MGDAASRGVPPPKEMGQEVDVKESKNITPQGVAAPTRAFPLFPNGAPRAAAARHVWKLHGGSQIPEVTSSETGSKGIEGPNVTAHRLDLIRNLPIQTSYAHQRKFRRKLPSCGN